MPEGLCFPTLDTKVKIYLWLKKKNSWTESEQKPKFEYIQVLLDVHMKLFSMALVPFRKANTHE